MGEMAVTRAPKESSAKRKTCDDVSCRNTINPSMHNDQRHTLWRSSSLFKMSASLSPIWFDCHALSRMPKQEELIFNLILDKIAHELHSQLANMCIGVVEQLQHCLEHAVEL